MLMAVAFPVCGIANNTLNVKSYAAYGDGIHDDTKSINNCLAAAASLGDNIYFPAGVYLVNKNVGTVILQYNAGGQSNINIYGAGNSQSVILTTKDTTCTQLYIWAYAKCYNIQIRGLTFSNTHHSTVIGQTNAMYVTGTGQNLINGIGWYNCAFSGFSNALIMQGVHNPTLKLDSFYSPAGHNNAQPNNNPAVYVTFADNSNGQCYNADVEQNYASGYTGPLPILVPRPLDGFLYGFCYGGLVRNNTTTMFSQEEYYLQNPTTNPSTTAAFVFENNYIDCSITSGWTDGTGMPHKYNYGIRTEASHVTVRNNYFLNYTTGILIYGYQFPLVSCTDYSITGNILIPGNDTTLYALGKSIFVQGTAQHPITGLVISNNHADSTSIFTTTCTNPMIYSNPPSAGLVP